MSQLVPVRSTSELNVATFHSQDRSAPPLSRSLTPTGRLVGRVGPPVSSDRARSSSVSHNKRPSLTVHLPPPSYSIGAGAIVAPLSRPQEPRRHFVSVASSSHTWVASTTPPSIPVTALTSISPGSVSSPHRPQAPISRASLLSSSLATPSTVTSSSAPLATGALPERPVSIDKARFSQVQDKEEVEPTIGCCCCIRPDPHVQFFRATQQLIVTIKAGPPDVHQENYSRMVTEVRKCQEIANKATGQSKKYYQGHLTNWKPDLIYIDFQMGSYFRFLREQAAEREP